MRSSLEIRSIVTAILCLAVLFGWLGPASTTPIADDRREAFEHWKQHDMGSAMRIDHAAWEAFLLHYLRPGKDGVHRLAYGRVSEQDYAALSDYIDAMTRVDIILYRRSEQMAYWINLYNALTVKLIIDHYPIASIRKIRRQSDGPKTTPWSWPLVTIDGVSLSLNDIENRILTPIWSDPRVHYAITCAAVGCPNLQPVPFSGPLLEQQLSDAVMAYVNDPRCIRIEDDELHVSSFYRWNLQAFGGSERAIIQHLMAYAEPDLAMRLQTFDRLHGDRFDWRLNDSR